jgi:hypothetical protein
VQVRCHGSDSDFVDDLAGGQIAEGAAMTNHYDDYHVIIDTLSWGFWIIPPLVLSFFFAWKAVRWLRNRGKSDGVVVEEWKDPWDQAISRPAADYYSDGISFGSEGGLGGMNRREQDELLLFAGTPKQQRAIRKRRRAAKVGMTPMQLEEFLLIHGSRQERKAIKERRKAREEAKKRSQTS